MTSSNGHGISGKSDLARKAIVWTLLILPLLGWWAYGLFDLDEGFYAAVAGEMNRHGTWITPLFNGHPWYEKPILLYWIAKPAIAIFGQWIGPRLPSILATLCTYGLIQWFGNKRLGQNAGTLATLVLGTSVLFVGAGRMMLVDPLLVLSLTACFLFFWESLVSEKNAIGWRIASAAALGFAFLAKGPVGGIFFLAIAGYTAWRMPELRSKFKGGWLPAIGVFLLVVGAWYVPAYLIDRQVFVQKFIIEQNLNRFAGGDEAHAVKPPIGFLYYVGILFLGFIPWSVTLFKSWPAKGQADVKTYLAAWAVVIFGFFTISTTKLPHYILPCMPPLALLVGSYLAKKPLTDKRLVGFAVGSVALCAIANAGFIGYWNSFHSEIQNLALEAKADHGDADFALFALAKTGKPDPVGAPKPKLFDLITIDINETSHPSLLFYLDRDVTETDKFGEILKLEQSHLTQPTVILTRPGRFPVDAEKEAADRGLLLKKLDTKTKQVFYEAYMLSVR